MSQVDVFPVSANKLFHVNPDPDIVSIGSLQTKDIVVNCQSHGLSSTSFRYDLSPNTLLDKQIFLRVQVKARMSASANARTIDAGNEAKLIPVARPLARSMKSLSVGLNGTQLNVEPHLYVPAQNQYSSDDYIDRYGSLSPCMPDSCMSIAGMIDQSGGAYGPYQVVNPKARGGFRPSVVTNTAAAAGNPEINEYTYEFVEALPHPWLSVSDESERESIKKAKTLSIDIAWLSGNYATMFQNLGAVDSAGGACVIEMVDNSAVTAQLFMRTYISPTKLPAVVSHSYVNPIIRTFVSADNLATNGTSTISTGNIVLPQVPHRLWVYLTRSTDYNGISQTDCFARINQVSLRTDKDQGLFSQCNNRMLYDYALQNGYNGTYQDFSLLRGSVLCFDLAQGDISGYIAGSKEAFSFDMQVQFQNIAYNNATLSTYLAAGGTVQATYRLVVIAEMDSKLLLDGSSAVITGGIGKNELLSALQTKEVMEVSEPRGASASGGSWRGFLRGIKRVAGSILPLASTALLFRNPAAGLALGAVGSALNGQTSAQDAVRQVGAQGFLGNAPQPLTTPSGAGFKLRG